MEWRCTFCGRPHPENDPPCENCGHHDFERTVVPAPEFEVDDPVEWVCAECGRVHPRNTPPCSRCGSPDLEMRRVDYDAPVDATAPGYLDLASPRYLLAAGVAVLLAGVLLLGVVGVVDLPAPGPDRPTVSDVPGEATEAGGLSLSTVEDELVTALGNRRRAEGRTALDRDATLDAVAEYVNRKRVKAEYAGGERADLDRAFEGFGASCPRTPVVSVLETTGRPDATAGEFGSEADLARELARLFAERSADLGTDRSSVGVDVHVAPDGAVYVTRVVC